MMKLLLAVWIMSCSSALMPPTNLTVQSQNFNHTLHWLPAADTPPGTEYCIYLGYGDSNQSDTLLSITKATSLSVSVFMKDIFEEYTLSVWARTNNHSSLPATTTFEPINTVLGPPLVRVEGCGDCLHVISTLLHGDGIKPEDFEIYSRAVKFNIQWRKANEDTVRPLQSTVKETKINNLVPGERYCVKVVLDCTSYPNTLASDWQCAWTSPASRPAGLYLLGWSVGTVCVGVLLMMLSSGLYYSGAICRPKLKLPQNLSARFTR
ncbi:interferon alpha/beta receptor 2-like [Sardina pilchardus]|uniref:interferon alpha/beta receptor 2-like n=1 Tax=Sardina pilchardus TaxID=27697 RepID=UPI002E0E3779